MVVSPGRYRSLFGYIVGCGKESQSGGVAAALQISIAKMTHYGTSDQIDEHIRLCYYVPPLTEGRYRLGD